VQQAKGELVNALIARGANLEAKRADGRTAVTLAERGGQFPILRALWKAGAKRPSRFFGLRRRRV
jgi:ankyrin repeat protein